MVFVYTTNVYIISIVNDGAVLSTLSLDILDADNHKTTSITINIPNINVVEYGSFIKS